MCCEKEMRPCRLVLSLITFIICAFDVGTDWYSFSQFFKYKEADFDKQLTYGLAALSAVGTIIFLLELRNGIHAYRTYTSHADDVSGAERSLERWQEVITFLQIVLEDCPITIIMYLAFREASCGLYLQLFDNSFTANLALLGAFVSAAWKVLMSFIYCCFGCCIGVAKDCGTQCCCCCCRTFRSIVSVLLLAFAAYLFFTFNDKGFESRDDC